MVDKSIIRSLSGFLRPTHLESRIILREQAFGGSFFLQTFFSRAQIHIGEENDGQSHGK
jgi:hypothetical protein